MEERTLSVLRGCPLFEQIDTADLPGMLACLSAQTRSYAKGQAVFLAGGRITAVGIVLSGSVNILQEDYWGNRTILAHVAPGGLFGEAFSCAGTESIPVSVLAAQRCEILLIDYRKIVTSCSSACAFHARLVQNMLRILAKKNVSLTQKMETITQRSTRQKLLAYLSQQARRAQNGRFTIPFNRQELADYLAVDRSAMSSELSKMQRDGLLHYDKNQFELLSE